jgi:NAD(P)-dependent dehydrogenase (short-subunit alcohol dehydrogenase family)
VAIADDMFDFTGSVVMMTGAARGIGRQASLLFAELGADLALVDRNAEGLAQTDADVRALGRRSVAIGIDVRNAEDCSSAVERAVAELGQLDVLVNCAGGSRTKPLDATTIDDFDAMMALNIRGPWALTMAAIPHLRARRGNVVNVSSMASMTSVPHSVPYGIAKAGLNNMTMALAGTLGKEVRLNCLALSSVKTEGFIKAMEATGVDPAVTGAGEPEDVAWATVFLASKACRFMNGVTIPLTG